MSAKKSAKKPKGGTPPTTASQRAVGTRANGAPNQAARVVRLLKWLHQTPRGLTVSEIMEKMRVDPGSPVVERQVNRDLKYIVTAGIELEVRRVGKTPVYCIPAEERVMMIKSAKEGISLAMQLLKDVLPQSSKVKVDELVESIPAIARYDDAAATFASDQLMLSIQAGTWGRDIDAQILAESFAAVASKRNVLVRYGAPTDPEYCVLPCKITMYLGRLYMIVYDQTKLVYFVYAIDKIHAIRPAPNSKVQHHRFDDQKFMETRFGIWSSISDPRNPSGIYDVVVDVIDRDGKKYMLREFVDRKWHPSQKSKFIDEHTIQLSFRCGVSPELVSWVLRWAPHIRVVEPVFLKKEVRKRAEELMKML